MRAESAVHPVCRTVQAGREGRDCRGCAAGVEGGLGRNVQGGPSADQRKRGARADTGIGVGAWCSVHGVGWGGIRIELQMCEV